MQLPPPPPHTPPPPSLDPAHNYLSPHGHETTGKEEDLGRLNYLGGSRREGAAVGCDPGYTNAMFTTLHNAVVGPTDGGQRREDTARVGWFPSNVGAAHIAGPEAALRGKALSVVLDEALQHPTLSLMVSTHIQPE